MRSGLQLAAWLLYPLGGLGGKAAEPPQITIPFKNINPPS
jgi:hypothetical protein